MQHSLRTLAKPLAPVFWLFSARAANAHASEQGFVLLMPTDIYISAGAAAVFLSIILVSFVTRPRVEMLFTPVVLWRLPSLTWMRTGVSLLSCVVLFALLYVGMFGPHDPLRNLLPLVIWTVWWIALVTFQGAIGNVWAWVNPWSGLYEIVFGTSNPDLQLSPGLVAWPAVIVLLAFFGFLMADIAPGDPKRLAIVAFCYWGFTSAGMVIFGAQKWLSQVECFSVLFALIGRLAPMKWTDRFKVGLPGWQLLHGQKPDVSHAVFCLVLLGAGSFDGLHETFWWLNKIGINPLEFPGRSAVIWSTGIGLIGAILALICVFALAVQIGVQLSNKFGAEETKIPFTKAFALFSTTLLPIAFGYHLAHYLTAFLVQGQYVLVALSDPLSNGANLMGFGRQQVTTGFLYARDSVALIWSSQAVIVVGSHVLSVLMAHHIASQLCQKRRNAVLLQIGIGALMIVYTIFGLWLLASPRGA